MTGTTADMFDGIAGQWVSNDVAETFVSGQPYPRVVAFRMKGGASPFRVTTNDQFYGVRTWFLEPVQLNTAPQPALQPATVERQNARTLRLVAAPEKETQLQAIMEVTLDANLPRLGIRHGLKNTAAQQRRLAAWAIMAFPHTGIGVAPWAEGKETIRSYLLFAGVNPTEPSLHMDCAGVGIDFRVPVRGSYVKIGTNADRGWAAYLWQGQALKSSVPWVSGAEYPEGGGTVTLFQTGKRANEGFCEVEHVGPLSDVAPGAILWLEQTMELIPNVATTASDPGGWLQAVGGASKRNAAE